ncbi:P44/Msp2 family outer membrane protein [Anaplasma phagocytophilum]|uniref:Surface antigen family protein n=20 Tax=Anaplasma phagocytophilum TaxID=948 RepID=A0A0F3PVQ7_ANAPH|nr:P44/Msp2 family outer membrane protein [Anaplasma phagocytophilum]KJV83574.1 surface antigen family protein [Anaplasma phagocytophilum str. HGE2]KJV84465.1 surface antigen family protein [Anaplasma phagocytophilum str. ApWI1]KJV99628.1 surface antigen family protein [Anaplasma phagocytophilum str. Annie]KJZ99183.1 surface antigen family protein [Anaplasma phagocytophilum str. CR1007]KJZ99955.1 surface antigen family protein [Anaplasma phagocytophilum]
MMSMAIVMAGNEVRAHDDVSALETGGAGYFYVGLDYSPAFSKIRDFSIRESNGETKAVYPYLKDGKSVKLESHKFDWNTPDPRIGFKDNMLVAMEGSVGYGIGGARVELEIGYERFKTKGIRDSGSKEDEADTVYLLAKELAYDVVTGQTDNLAAALAKTSGKDIVQFAKAVEISHSEIDGKVCKTKSAGTGKNPCDHSQKPCSTNAYYARRTQKSRSSGKTSLCGDSGYSGQELITGGHYSSPSVFRNFVKDTLQGNGSENWPTSTGEGSESNDNAIAVAKDLVNELTPEERTIVAGLLAKIIEGSEVIEIRAISSTSVTMNICSDITISNILMPYVCVGPGMSFVSVVDGHTAAKFAYRLKAGLSYKFSKEVTAFAGGFYHHVIGDGVYDDLPLRHLSDDISPVKHAKETAIARFVMRYFGGEFGVRLAF